MSVIHFITGGQRSGKSSFAQRCAGELSKNPTYLATARVWDADFEKRIERHKADRGAHWNNVEIEIDFSEQSFDNKVIVLDCITLWLTNIFFENAYDMQISLQKAQAIWDRFILQNVTAFVVSNEIGMGLHAETEVGRKFTDLQGFMNQYIAKKADSVTCMISGIPMTIK